MAYTNDIQVYCLTPLSHSHLLHHHADSLLRLSHTHPLRIFSSQETSPPVDATPASLNIRLLQSHLSTLWLAHTLIYTPRTTSTQDVLTRLFPTADRGWVAVSGYQTAGRGRRGAEWVSPAGSVAMSLALRVPRERTESLTFLQYVAALAVVDAVHAVEEWRGVNVRIKWPNDVYVKESKIGGVLCEGVLRADKFWVTVGVGVNVTNEHPTSCLRHAVEQGSGGSSTVEGVDMTGMRERFIAIYLCAFERLYDEYCERGFEGRIMERYLKAWMHSEQVVRLGKKNGPRGVIKGLAPNGWVRVFREDLQAMQDLPPEAMSLDLDEGVIREKQVGRRDGGVEE